MLLPSTEPPRVPIADQQYVQTTAGNVLIQKREKYINKYYEENDITNDTKSNLKPSLQRCYRLYRSLNKAGKRLLGFICLNLVYLVLEAGYGLTFNHHALVSDAFHLGFGCGVLSVSLAATFYARMPADSTFSYGYPRCEVLAAFTNVCFLVFVSFSSGVEALHQLIEPESDHHRDLMLITSLLNLAVNLTGVIAFRTHARIHLTYQSAQDMNLHAIFLHVATDSLKSGGTITHLWLSAVGIPNSDALVSLINALLIMLLCLPLLNQSGRYLLQGSPAGVEEGLAVAKWVRSVGVVPGVQGVRGVKVWALQPGQLVATATLTLKSDAQHQQVLTKAHAYWNQHFGPSHLTLQIERGDSGPIF